MQTQYYPARPGANLGILYDKGRGVSQDFAEASKWFRKAAEQGYVNAQFTGADCFGRTSLCKLSMWRV